MSVLKKLGSDSIIYGLGGILSKSLSFFLLPVYTRIFSLNVYGKIEMLTIISSFLSAFLVMGMDSAQSMYFYKVKKDGHLEQAKIVTSILQWRIIWGSVIVLLATIVSPLLNEWFFLGQLSWDVFAIAFSGSLFAQVMRQSVDVMRLLYRPWGYIAISLAQTVLSAGLILVFVLLFNQGLLGFFLGATIASFLMAIFGWVSIRSYCKFDRIYWNFWPMLLRFGLPFLPSGLAIYFMNTADRWFVQYYHGEEALGLFAVAAKFCMLLTLGVETFRQAWWPIAMEAIHEQDGPAVFRMIARLYMGIACAGIVVLTFLSPWLVRWFTGAVFHDAWPIVGVLAWQAVFYGFFLIVSAGIWKAEKTYLNLPLMGGAAVLGLILNQLFVPTFGAIGAALATALTYFVWVVATLLVSNRFWKVAFQNILMLSQVAVAVIYIIFYIFINQQVSFLVNLILCILTVLTLSVSSVGADERNLILLKIYEIMRK